MFLVATLFLVLLVTLLLLTRLQSQMAALVAWIVGTIAGSRGENKEQDNKDSSEKSKSKPKKGRQKEKKSPTKEPAFTTTLTTPIEDVIEETINEEVTSGESVESKPSRKPRKRNKSTKKKAKSTEYINDEDDVGFSFFRTKSVDSVQQQISKVTTKKRLEEPNPHISEDPYGFSFLPVKRTSRKNQKPKIDDSPKSSLIEHFQPKKSERIVSPSKIQDNFVVVEKSKTNEEIKAKSQDNLIEIVNQSSGKVVYIEAKESKKVHSKISYASVTSQRFEDLECLLKEEKAFSVEEIKETTATEAQANEEFVKEAQAKEEIVKAELTEPIQLENLEKSWTNHSENDFEIIVEDKATDGEKSVDKNELVSEIASEERRLVDLLEEAQNKTDEESSLEEKVGIEAKEENSSDIETLDSENFSTDEDIPVEENIKADLNEDTENVKTAIIEKSEELNVDREFSRKLYISTNRGDITDITVETKRVEVTVTHESEEVNNINNKSSSKSSPSIEEGNIIKGETLQDNENLPADVTLTQIREEIDNIKTELYQAGPSITVEDQSSFEVLVTQKSEEVGKISKPALNLDEEVVLEVSESVEFINEKVASEEQSSEDFDSVHHILTKTESVEVILGQKSEDLSFEPDSNLEANEVIEETEVAVAQRSEEINNINTELSSKLQQSADEEVVIEQSSVDFDSAQQISINTLDTEVTLTQINKVEPVSDLEETVTAEVTQQSEENIDEEVKIEDQSSVDSDSIEHIFIKTVNPEIISSLKSEDLPSESTPISEEERVSEEGKVAVTQQSEELSVKTELSTKFTQSIDGDPTVEEQSSVYSDGVQHISTKTESARSVPTQGEDLSSKPVPITKTIEDVDLDNTKLSDKPFKMSSGTQVRVLTLNDKEHQDSVLYRIEKNWILQFRLGPSLLGRKVSLYCNYPKEGEDFNRNLYHLLQWSQDEGCNYSDDTALLTELTPKISGSFHYYFTYENAEEDEHQGSGFFLVDPVLKCGKNEELPLDCIQCQTFLSKSLGSFDSWESKLKVAKESGYNMIHFTPIQELGVSNSSYSLSEQLKVNPIFTKEKGEKTTFEDIENLIAKMRTEWKMVSICDIVLNHTANESEWLQEHPEVTYNCQNCPYMRPSYLLDAALHQFSLDVARGLYEDKGIPTEVNTEEHLSSIRYYLHTDVLPMANIPELFICDVSKYLVEFLNLARSKVPPNRANSTTNEELKVTQDPQFRRLGSTIDMNLAVKLYNVYRHDCFDEETRLKRCAEDLKNKLEYLNSKIIDTVNEHLNVAVESVIAGMRYFRVQQDGPKIKEVTVKNPLAFRYFTDHGTPKSFKEHEEVMYSDNGRFLMAHNGWVLNSDPLRNFAAPGSNVYLRRELIAWGDSVKLRFGDKPEDCPFLWNHMKSYVEQTARIFDGVRLDNCHSTPIPVAEYLLDCARKVRTDLYVVAELFTNSDMTDNIFVNRLGITSLIREAMSAWDSHEQGRLVYRYGGSPVGSFYQPRVRPLVPSIAHALFLDLTHDNPSPIEKRSVFDLLPSTALVNMACCASGSNRGYDELVPHHIHVVDETRQYTEWTDDDDLAAGKLKYVTNKSGIIAAKKALNDLHYHLGVEGFNQVYVDQMDPDIVAVTRHCPETHESYVLVAFTAFSHPPEDAARNQRGIKPLRVEGVLDEIVLEATLSHIAVKSQGSKYTKFQNFLKDNRWINGLSEYQVHLRQHIQPPESEIFERVDSGAPNVVQLNFKNFKPGSVAVIKMSLPEDMREAIKNVRNLIRQFSIKKETELWKIIGELTLPDLNRALYRCSQEERDEGHDFDTYNIPNFGNLVYAGLQGFMSLLCNIRPNNDLGHPMCANLRDGNWMIDYIWKRLKLDEGTKRLGQWFEENAKSLKQIPRYLVPCYFDVIVTGIYVLLIEQSYNLMSEFVKSGSTFVKGLSMGSLQFAAYIKSADLPTLSPNLSEPKPPQRTENGKTIQACVSLSAGLPHFSVGYMRNWGRDTFIALRGLFLLTGRYQDARYHILGYAACLRHGLIPNLLDGGRNSRFNCRDAIWWWLHCIKCYVEDAPNGIAILTDKVSRIFPDDESPARPAGAVDQPLHDVIQEALTVHFQGLVFRERNAGRQIDEHMTDQGFHNQIGIHPETGFVFGGNSFNCGTWMDKMGSSEKAGNRGKPATPRDGSAVELVGLAKCATTWLDSLNKEGLYPYDGVKRTHKNGSVTKWSFSEWAQKIQDNFEKYFWVNTTPAPGEIRPDLINKRGIYKDCHGASQEWTDFQLRCNFPVAMVVAPELFDPQHAWVALQKAEKYLLGPLGMKTLDPEDWAYNGNYDNSNDSDNHNVAHGFNYHQGPEWVWPVGFYLRAKLQFAAANGELEKTVASTKVVLSRHFVELQTSTWRGLPELTNQDGEFCKDSSRTQAWSMSCILEVLHDLQKIEKEQPLIN